MPEAISSIAFEIDPENADRLVKAHDKAVAALKKADVGFIDGTLYRMENEGSCFDLWRWQSEEAAAEVTALRVKIKEVRAYTRLIVDEPLYMEGVAVR